MRLPTLLVVVVLLGTVAADQVLAAIPAARPSHKAQTSMVADARAAEPAPARVPLASLTPPEADRLLLVERMLRQRDNFWSARLDDLHARIYEVAGQAQLVASCLIGLVLAMFVWLASITRQVAQLAAEVRAERSGGFG